ncbi:MAG: MmcQ/YjbR family DNA-binding protein, partial [Dehalococcoidia bacterium]
ALTLPEAEEGPSYDTPGFRVRGKLFAWLREDGELLVVRIDRGEREALIAEAPLVFLVTPHYESYPFILVRLDTVDPEHLQELLIEAWRLAAPKRLVAAYDAGTIPSVP